MNFYEKIKEMSKQKKLIIFVDMDGVVACYDVGNPYNFLEKRPLFTNINILKKVQKLPNIELHILSIGKKDSDILDKNKWLDKYIPFISYDKRTILSKESNNNLEARIIKLNYLKTLDTDRQIVLVDDDNVVLKTIRKEMDNVILFQDSELVD